MDTKVLRMPQNCAYTEKTSIASVSMDTYVSMRRPASDVCACGHVLTTVQALSCSGSRYIAICVRSTDYLDSGVHTVLYCTHSELSTDSTDSTVVSTHTGY